MSYGRCTRRYCGTLLEERHDKNFGRVTLSCPACERNKAGLCRDCSRDVKPGAMRCRSCGVARAKKKHSEYQTWRYNNIPSDRAHRLKREKRRAKDPVVRARRNATAKAWREQHPRTDLDRTIDRIRAAKRSRKLRERENARRRQRYATDPDYRARDIARGRIRRADPMTREINRLKERAKYAAAKLAASPAQALLEHSNSAQRVG